MKLAHYRTPPDPPALPVRRSRGGIPWWWSVQQGALSTLAGIAAVHAVPRWVWFVLAVLLSLSFLMLFAFSYVVGPGDPHKDTYRGRLARKELGGHWVRWSWWEPSSPTPLYECRRHRWEQMDPCHGIGPPSSRHHDDYDDHAKATRCEDWGPPAHERPYVW